MPFPLPPRDPALDLSEATEQLLNTAEEALRRLDLASAMVPSLDWFVFAFVRKEAVVSSQIEGTQATLVDLLELEAAGSPSDTADPDLQEVCNYLEAMLYARGELPSNEGLPLSMRLLNRTHAILMRGVRGADKQPGEIRRSQNWIAAVRLTGDWEGWTRFFLEGVATIASEATDAARELFALVMADRQRVLEARTSTLAAARLFEVLPRRS